MNPQCHDCDNEDWCIDGWHKFLMTGKFPTKRIHCPYFPQKEDTEDGIG